MACSFQRSLVHNINFLKPPGYAVGANRMPVTMLLVEVKAARNQGTSKASKIGNWSKAERNNFFGLP